MSYLPGMKPDGAPDYLPLKPTTETTRPLTVNEANKPILDIMGEQSLMGVLTPEQKKMEEFKEKLSSSPDLPDYKAKTSDFELGAAEYKPQTQTVQEDEKLTTTGKTLTPEGVSATTSTAATPDSVGVTAQNAAQVNNVERTYTNLPTTTAQQGEVSEGAIIDPSQVVDERTKAEMFERGSLAEAKTQTLAQEATTKYQVEQLMASLDAGSELPPWAAPAVRKARSIMNAR